MATGEGSRSRNLFSNYFTTSLPCSPRPPTEDQLLFWGSVESCQLRFPDLLPGKVQEYDYINDTIFTSHVYL